MTARPRLKPHLRPLLRGDGTVQFGTAPDRGVVLAGLAVHELALVQRLDGTLDDEELVQWAAERGVLPQRTRAVLAVLREQRLMVELPAGRGDFAGLPEPDRAALAEDASTLAAAYGSAEDGYAVLARRRHQHVLVDGRGSLAVAVADLLRRAGVRRVSCGREAADEWLGSPAASGRPGLGLQPGRRTTRRAPDLVVIAGRGALDAARARPWRAHGIPHLAVLLEEAQAVVGPLVPPAGRPCLACLDLARTDLDPGWPALLGQLVPAAVGAPPETNGETALVAVAAGMASMVALAAIDGQPVPAGRSLEVGLPWPRIRQRQWEPHPACDCAGDDTRGQPDLGGDTGQVTMAG